MIAKRFNSKIKINSVMISLQTLWKFSRPHTLIGTTVSIIGIYLLVINKFAYFSAINLQILVFALLAMWLGNIYITGLNQITDLEIDKINKPHLPLVSGKMTFFEAKIVVIITGILSLVFSWIINIFLGLTLLLGLCIGTAYSLPPIRLKRIPYLASLSIFTVRGVVVNFGIYLFFKDSLGEPLFFSLDIIFLTCFISMLSLAISLLKDIPDITGDSIFNISTFSVKYGRKNIFFLSTAILIFDYVFSIVFGFIYSQFWNFELMSVTQGILLIILLFQVRGTNLENRPSITQFYMFVWELFYIEYLLLPFLRI